MNKRYGFVRKFYTSDASRYDGKVLSQLLDKENTASNVWGDTAYRCKENEQLLQKNGFVSKLHRKKPKGKDSSELTLKLPLRTSFIT